MSQSNGKRSVGRPRVLTDGKKKEILAAISMGASRRIAAAYVGVSHQTIGAEAERDSEFSTALVRAESDSVIRHLKIIEKAGEGGDWRASAWFLARRFPESWSEHRRYSHEHDISNDGEAITVVTDANWFKRNPNDTPSEDN